MPDLTPAEARVRAALRHARERAGMSQPALALALGWSQTKVTRSETGGRHVTIADIEAWAEATRMSAADRDELLRASDEATVYALTWGRLFRDAGGAAARQATYAERERAAKRIINFEMGVIPGLAQTPEYARRLLALLDIPAEEIPAMVAARMDRQRILHEPGRDITLLTTEAALNLRIGPPGVMREQLDRLVSLIGLPTVTLGVIPAAIDAPAVPVTSYHLLLRDEGGEVTVETLTREVDMQGEAEVARHLADAQAWREVAAVDDDARKVILAAAEALGTA